MAGWYPVVETVHCRWCTALDRGDDLHPVHSIPTPFSIAGRSQAIESASLLQCSAAGSLGAFYPTLRTVGGPPVLGKTSRLGAGRLGPNLQLESNSLIPCNFWRVLQVWR